MLNVIGSVAQFEREQCPVGLPIPALRIALAGDNGDGVGQFDHASGFHRHVVPATVFR
jgi:hypothetical protein